MKKKQMKAAMSEYEMSHDELVNVVRVGLATLNQQDDALRVGSDMSLTMVNEEGTDEDRWLFESKVEWEQ